MEITFYDKNLEGIYNATLKAFNYMNGKVNIVNSNCQLIIDLNTHDIDRYAEIFASKSTIKVFLRVIIQQDLDRNDGRWNKNTMYTNICMSIAHELMHMDQVYDRKQYWDSQEYYDTVEFLTELSAAKWIKENRIQLEELLGFKLDENLLVGFLPGYTYDSLDKYGYMRHYVANVDQIYRCIFENLFMGEFHLPNYNEIINKCLSYSNITIIFLYKNKNGELTNIIEKGIKVDNNWNQNIYSFSKTIYDNFEYYDHYCIRVGITNPITDDDSCKIIFEIEDQWIDGVYFLGETDRVLL